MQLIPDTFKLEGVSLPERPLLEDHPSPSVMP